MYDHVKISLTNDKLDKIMDNADSHKNIIDLTSGESTDRGNVGNIQLYKKGDTLKLSGSLAIFYFGNNVRTLTVDEVKLAVEKLETKLDLDLSKGQIKSLEVGENFILKEPCQNYFHYFGTLSRKRRRDYKHGIYYSGESTELVMYDKIRDVKRRSDKFKNIPAATVTKNILRIEIRIKKNVHKIMKKNSPVLVSDLYNVNFYKECKEKLKALYFKITKLPSLPMNYFPTSKSELIKYLTCIVINDASQKSIIESHINIGFLQGLISKRNKHRMLGYLNNNPAYNHNPHQSEYIIELDEKVNSI